LKNQIYRILDIIHKNNKIKIKKCILGEGGLNNFMSYASREESVPENVPEEKKIEEIIKPIVLKKKLVEITENKPKDP
jgi:hypothetical protein